MRAFALVALGLAASCLCGCSVSRVPKSPDLSARARWAVLPISNHSETPLAGERVESLLATILQSKGIADLARYPALGTSPEDAIAMTDDQVRLVKATQWAQAQRVSYGVTGSVEEWKYKSGPDADPVVGVTLQVIDLGNQRVVWSATCAKTGWGRSSASGTAISVLEELVDGLKVTP